MDIDINIKKIINTKPKTIPIWRTIMIYIVFYWIRFYHFITGYQYPKGPKTENDIMNEYKEKQQSRFIKNLQSENANQNIEPVFYKKKKYQEMMKIENNEIEIKWRTRILIENTVRGNIIMFYDTYKQGFSYYSDNKTIPYDLMNAVAMKFTVLYSCRDFFMDEVIFPDTFISPLIKIQEDDKDEDDDGEPKDEKEEEKKKEKERIAELRKNPVFAKLKTYRETETNQSLPEAKISLMNSNIPFAEAKILPIENEQKKDEEEKKDEKLLVVNKFIYMGKIANYSIIQKPKKKLRELSLVSKEVSYKDYKQHYR